MIYQQGLPSTSVEVDKESWCRALGSFLPSDWHINFDKESPDLRVQLMKPYQRTLIIGTKRTYGSAMQVARSLCRSARELDTLTIPKGN